MMLKCSCCINYHCTFVRLGQRAVWQEPPSRLLEFVFTRKLPPPSTPSFAARDFFACKSRLFVAQVGPEQGEADYLLRISPTTSTLRSGTLEDQTALGSQIVQEAYLLERGERKKLLLFSELAHIQRARSANSRFSPRCCYISIPIYYCCSYSNLTKVNRRLWPPKKRIGKPLGRTRCALLAAAAIYLCLDYFYC